MKGVGRELRDLPEHLAAHSQHEDKQKQHRRAALIGQLAVPGRYLEIYQCGVQRQRAHERKEQMREFIEQRPARIPAAGLSQHLQAGDKHEPNH